MEPSDEIALQLAAIKAPRCAAGGPSNKDKLMLEFFQCALANQVYVTLPAVVDAPVSTSPEGSSVVLFKVWSLLMDSSSVVAQGADVSTVIVVTNDVIDWLSCFPEVIDMDPAKHMRLRVGLSSTDIAKPGDMLVQFYALHSLPEQARSLQLPAVHGGPIPVALTDL